MYNKENMPYSKKLLITPPSKVTSYRTNLENYTGYGKKKKIIQ